DCSRGLSIVALDASAVRTRVIASAYGLEAATRSCALAMRLVATSSCALVIFLVDLTVRTRRRRANSCAAMASGFLDLAGGRFVAIRRGVRRLGRRLVD